GRVRIRDPGRGGRIRAEGPAEPACACAAGRAVPAGRHRGDRRRVADLGVAGGPDRAAGLDLVRGDVVHREFDVRGDAAVLDEPGVVLFHGCRGRGDVADRVRAGQ